MSRTVEQLVDREVYYPVDALINELSSNEQYQDDLLPIMAQDDYAIALEESDIEQFEDEYGATCWKDEKGDTCAGDAQTACEFFNIEPHTNEAYEHWIVSNWLADRLEAKGEMVIKDFLGLTIWGRACSGQAIYLDGVIQEIHQELIT